MVGGLRDFCARSLRRLGAANRWRSRDRRSNRRREGSNGIVRLRFRLRLVTATAATGTAGFALLAGLSGFA
jgi:hypothetical protein